MFTTEPISDRFGIAVHGLDLNEPMDDETAHALLDLLYEHRVLVVRGQQLAPGSFAAYGFACSGWRSVLAPLCLRSAQLLAISRVGVVRRAAFRRRREGRDP